MEGKNTTLKFCRKVVKFLIFWMKSLNFANKFAKIISTANWWVSGVGFLSKIVLVRKQRRKFYYFTAKFQGGVFSFQFLIFKSKYQVFPSHFWFQKFTKFNWLLMIYSFFCTTKVSPMRDHQVLKLKWKIILDHHIVVVVMIIGL